VGQFTYWKLLLYFPFFYIFCIFFHLFSKTFAKTLFFVNTNIWNKTFSLSSCVNHFFGTNLYWCEALDPSLCLSHCLPAWLPGRQFATWEGGLWAITYVTLNFSLAIFHQVPGTSPGARGVTRCHRRHQVPGRHQEPGASPGARVVTKCWTSPGVIGVARCQRQLDSKSDALPTVLPPLADTVLTYKPARIFIK
jgi:hypothetical protein